MTQKLAFKKTLVPGATMPAQVASLYASIKAYITNAGFSVLSFSDSPPTPATTARTGPSAWPATPSPCSVCTVRHLTTWPLTSSRSM